MGCFPKKKPDGSSWLWESKQSLITKKYYKGKWKKKKGKCWHYERDRIRRRRQWKHRWRLFVCWSAHRL